MSLPTVPRGARAASAVVGLLALTGCLGACGGGDGSDGETGASAPTSSGAVDPVSQTFGSGCGATSSESTMVDDPAGTAVSHDPMLSDLVSAARISGLLHTLNDTSKQYTVFAPSDAAFAHLQPGVLHQLMSGARRGGESSDLGKILLHHVLGEQLGPDSVAGEQTTAAGDTLTVAGDPTSGMTVSDGSVSAHVVCGNITTRNATVYVIDTVLTDKS